MLVQSVNFSVNKTAASKTNSQPVSVVRASHSTAQDTVNFSGAKLNALGKGIKEGLKNLGIGLKVLVKGSHTEEITGDGKLYSKSNTTREGVC